jgi:KaiC/GvpD/RAD55 family RecA-like ATPase
VNGSGYEAEQAISRREAPNARMQAILDRVKEVQPKRVVFDSLSEMRLLAQDPLRYRRQILALKQYFTGQDCTVLLLDDLSGGDTDLQSGHQPPPPPAAPSRRTRRARARRSSWHSETKRERISGSRSMPSFRERVIRVPARSSNS